MISDVINTQYNVTIFCVSCFSRSQVVLPSVYQVEGCQLCTKQLSVLGNIQFTLLLRLKKAFFYPLENQEYSKSYRNQQLLKPFQQKVRHPDKEDKSKFDLCNITSFCQSLYLRMALRGTDSILCASQICCIVVKNLPAKAGDARDVGSTPELGRCPEEESGNHPCNLIFYINLFILIGGQLIYNIVVALPYIDMNQPQVYMCSPS